MSEMSDAIEVIRNTLGGEVEAYIVAGQTIWTTRYPTEDMILSHVQMFHAVYPAEGFPLGQLLSGHRQAHGMVADTAHHIPHAHKERQ